jgi:intracellular septation protein
MTDATADRAKSAAGIKLLVDFGPLAIFFAVNALTGGLAITRVLTATVAFMVATAVAMIVSRWKLGHISPMLWMSGGLVLVFGSLTLWFHDSLFIKIKPTIVYSMFAAILGFGLATGRPLLKTLLESAYPGLTTEGWRKLTINWTIFFVGMAILNEVVWRITAPNADSDLTTWAAFKLWGAVPLTVVFALANIPMLLKHGLSADPKTVAETIPPEG